MLLRDILRIIGEVKFSEQEIKEIVDGLKEHFVEAEAMAKQQKRKAEEAVGMVPPHNRVARFYWGDDEAFYFEFPSEEEED